MKLYVFFHMVNGRDIRTTMNMDADFDIETFQDKLASEFASNKFMHSFEDDKLVIINMRNVASITISKAE